MLINRDNYEMYFLLYVDDELSMAERKALLVFLQENPDLKKELHQWQDAKINFSEEISFPDKESLYRNEDTDVVIHADNFEAYCLLYVDGELNEPNKHAVERYAAADHGRQQQLDLLLQTKLNPDKEIVFGNKEILFRKERTRIVPFIVFRLVAASLLLILAGWFVARVYFRNERTRVQTEIATKATDNKIIPEKKDLIKVTSPDNESLYLDSIRQLAEKIIETEGHTKPVAFKLTESRSPVNNPQKNKPEMQDSASADVLAEQPVETVLPAKNDREIASIATAQLSVSNKALPVAAPLEHTDNVLHPDSTQTSPEPKQEEGLNLMAFAEKKSRMRGIFRKVSRVLDKTTNGNEETNKHGVLIGSFQIALK